MSLFTRRLSIPSMPHALECELTMLIAARFVSKEIRDVLKKEPKMYVFPGPNGN